MTRTAPVLALFCLITLMPASTWAQTRSELIGTVTDASAAVLPGATVTLSSPNLVGGPQTNVTGADGTYRFTDLLPGIYAVLVDLQGFKTVRHEGLRVPFAATLTLDVKMEVASVAETITVAGAAPTVDVKSAAANTGVEVELLQGVPTNRGTSINAVNLAPGISAAIAYGATSLRAIAFRIDGVTTNNVSSGGTLGSYANVNWFQEIQVVALGAPAEYGEFTGASANQILRSGSNKFSGLAEYATQRWESDNRGSLPADFRAKFTRPEILANQEASLQLGGPIMRDRLFFFIGHMYYKNSTLPAGAVDRTVFATDHLPRTVGKVNWAVSPNVRVEGFLIRDKFDTEGFGAGITRRLETLALRDAPELKGTGRLTWTMNPRTLFEVRYNNLNVEQTVDPTPPGTRTGPYPRRDSFTGISSVNVPSWSFSKETRNIASASVTRYADQFLGKSHEIKFGAEFERARAQSQFGYPGGRTYIDFRGAPDQVRLLESYVTDANANRGSLYAQDAWIVNDRLTINPGVRVAFNRGSVPDHGTIFSTNPVSPRVGFAWDLAADHKTVLRAHYGRFHEALLANMFSFMNTVGQSPTITARVLSPGVFQELSRITPKSNLGIDANVTQPFMDQFTGGVEREVLPDTGVQVQYIYRRYRNILAFTDTGSQYSPVQRQDPGPDGILGTGDDGQFITVYNLLNPGNAFLQLTNPPDAYRWFNGLQFVLRKRYSNNWTALANYTLSKTYGSINNNESENSASGPDTGQSGIYVDPNKAINSVGNAEIDFTHQLKLEGTYHVSLLGGFNVGANFTYLTGGAWGRTAIIRGLNQGTETVRIEPRGAHRDPAYHTVDLRIEKTFPLGTQSRTAGIYLDVYNLNNQGVVSFIDGHGVGTIFASGATYGTPRQWIAPRLFRIGARVTF